MRPIEQIEQAAEKYRDSLLKESRHTMGMPRTFSQINAMAEGYAEGLYIAVEFAEWVHKNCSALCGTLWEFGKYPNSQACTSSELFAKFMAERNAQ